LYCPCARVEISVSPSRYLFTGRGILSRIMDIVCVYAVRGIGGLKNEAQRNVKADLLRNCPP
jgi:hypothetical protein